MRRGVAPRRLDQVLAAQQQPAGLRPAQEFAAAVDHHVGAARQIRARLLDVLRCRIDQHRNAPRLRPRDEILQPHLRLRSRPGCPARAIIATGSISAASSSAMVLDLDDMRADHADRLIIGEPLVLHHDHAVHPAIGEWQAQNLCRVIAGDAGRRGQRQRCGTAAGHNAAFRPGQLRDAHAWRLPSARPG